MRPQQIGALPTLGDHPTLLASRTLRASYEQLSLEHDMSRDQPSSTHGPASQRLSGRPSPPASALGALALLCLAACNPSCKSELTVTYEYPDAGPRPPPLPAVPGAEVDITLKEAVEIYARFRAACIRKDAQTLWDMLSDEIQQASERRAASLRTDPQALRAVFNYKRPADEFTGLELHRFDSFNGITRQFDELTLCARAKAWTMEAKGPQGREYLLLIKHPKAMDAGFFLRRDASGRIRVRPTSWNDAPSDPRYWVTYRFVRGEDDPL